MVQAHPVRQVTQVLQVHGQGVELALGSLVEAEVAAYLTQRFGAGALPADLARVLHQRTEGNPLFLVAAVDELVRQATPDVTRAEDCFHHALAIARRQQAKSWELRAALSLSRLWQHQGKHTEAYPVLAEVYHWFTEGFDTPDLQEAQALLAACEAQSPG